MYEWNRQAGAKSLRRGVLAKGGAKGVWPDLAGRRRRKLPEAGFNARGGRGPGNAAKEVQPPGGPRTEPVKRLPRKRLVHSGPDDPHHPAIPVHDGHGPPDHVVGE